MTTITVRFNHTDYRARILTGEDWQDAAKRAIRRAAGRSASAWGWTLDSREVDRDGNTVCVNYKATVVGRQTRYSGGHPVLGEAWVSL